jgi:hypothetical protein
MMEISKGDAELLLDALGACITERSGDESEPGPRIDDGQTTPMIRLYQRLADFTGWPRIGAVA